MDWAKVKLTADDFERGTSSGNGNYDHTWEEGKYAGSDCIRTKNIIPVSKAINIPIKNGWGYFVSYFGDNKKQLATSGWKTTVETIKLSSNIKYITLILKKTNGAIITVANLSNAFPGYIWTAGQPEFGKLKDESVYTKGRNLLKNSKDLLFHSTDYSGTVKLEKGKITLLKATQLTDAYCISSFNQSISGFIPIIDIRNMTTVEEPLTFAIDLKVSGLVNGTVTFYGDVRMPRIEGNNVTLTSSENGKWIRAYSHVNNVQQRDRAIFVVVPLNVSETDVGATIEYRNPAIYFGDEEIPWPSAPEDVDNPTEAV